MFFSRLIEARIQKTCDATTAHVARPDGKEYFERTAGADFSAAVEQTYNAARRTWTSTTYAIITATWLSDELYAFISLYSNESDDYEMIRREIPVLHARVGHTQIRETNRTRQTLSSPSSSSSPDVRHAAVTDALCLQGVQSGRCPCTSFSTARRPWKRLHVVEAAIRDRVYAAVCCTTCHGTYFKLNRLTRDTPGPRYLHGYT